MKTRTFQTRITGRACENFGAVDYTITETLTERVSGIEITVRSVGVSEGEHFDQRETRYAHGCKMESACAYRLTHGYVEVTS